MKKILGLTIAAVLILAVVGCGTWAYFSDTETSGTNTITAGRLNLKVGSSEPMAENITLSNKKPGETGNAASWQLSNTGTLDGTFSVTVSSITNNENTRYNMETAAGDSTDVGGELGTLLKLAFWGDKDGSSNWTSGDYYLSTTNDTIVAWASGATLPTAAYATLNSFSVKNYLNKHTITATDATGYFKVEYDFPDAGNNGDNIAQSDDVQFTITFDLNQS